MLAPMGMLVIYGGLGGRNHGDVLAAMRGLGRICPAVRSFSIHAWDHLVEERRAGMRALIDMLGAGAASPPHSRAAQARRCAECARAAGERRGDGEAAAAAVGAAACDDAVRAGFARDEGGSTIGLILSVRGVIS